MKREEMRKGIELNPKNRCRGANFTEIKVRKAGEGSSIIAKWFGPEEEEDIGGSEVVRECCVHRNPQVLMRRMDRQLLFTWCEVGRGVTKGDGDVVLKEEVFDEDDDDIPLSRRLEEGDSFAVDGLLPSLGDFVQNGGVSKNLTEDRSHVAVKLLNEDAMGDDNVALTPEASQQAEGISLDWMEEVCKKGPPYDTRATVGLLFLEWNETASEEDGAGD
ncbi:hypothetical protein Acr_05g0014870 [Actinidia rufa]|uniref:Uncharacterized protein n=1 Tax=Actinidia rufa TaxID=165716 RepID=A0A7J0EMY4_9ERIC|nr:hypothetical protein Acr_05g0014870 [Actinidia rufa]